MTSYSQTIKQIRERHKLNAKDVSLALGKDPFWLARVESGTTELEVEDVPPLAHELHCTIDDMFFGS